MHFFSMSVDILICTSIEDIQGGLNNKYEVEQDMQKY